MTKFNRITAAILLAVVVLFPSFRGQALGENRLAVERQVYQYLTQKMKLNQAAACGILANMEKESAFSPTVSGDAGTSYGLCQWHDNRYSALVGFCGAFGLDFRSVKGQMEFLNYELRTKYGSLLRELWSVENSPAGAYMAAYYWCIQFERPAGMEISAAERGELARRKYWNRYSGSLPQEPDQDPVPAPVPEMLPELPPLPKVPMIPLPDQPEAPEADPQHPVKNDGPVIIRGYRPRHSPDRPEGAAQGLAAALSFFVWGDGKFRRLEPEAGPEPSREKLPA